MTPAQQRRAAISVERAINELRQGRPIQLSQPAASSPPAPSPALLCAALETTPPELCDALLAAASDAPAQLVIGRQRAEALRLALPASVAPAVALPLDDIDRELLLQLALSVAPAVTAGALVTAGPLQQAALRLAKHARLLPALLTLRWQPSFADVYDPLAVTAAAVSSYPSAEAAALVRVSEAPVQLRASQDCRFVLYRAGASTEHVAVLVGTPDPDRVTPVRLHSSCLTGDLFASLRCDCGDQLHTAVGALADSGGGVLLYLAQEGRNIGLANKLRAYQLQQQGHDTISADALLGFDQDERYYDVAAAMLRDLGIRKVRLLTNNPTKISALSGHGIDVVERVPVTGAVTAFNERYLATKKRAGHLL